MIFQTQKRVRQLINWFIGDQGEAEPSHPHVRVDVMAKKKSRPTPTIPEAVPALFDAHTHLYTTVRKMGYDLTGDPEAYREGVRFIMDRAQQAGVLGVCTVGDGIEETEKAVEAGRFHERVWSAVAVHPTEAHTVDETVRRRLQELAEDPRCVAIGETGIDKYWIGKDEDTPSLEVQEEAFRWHIDLAVKTGKPLMIHNREADEDILRVLEDAPQPDTVIMHCFSSPLDVAKECLHRGYILSFSGNATFKRNEDLREALRIAEAEQILVETDAPFMTPEPYRGARNEPAFVGHTARALAEVRGMEPEDFGRLVTSNARRIYGIDEK